MVMLAHFLCHKFVMSLLQYFQPAEAVQQTYCAGGRRRVDDDECGEREVRERREEDRERE